VTYKEGTDERLHNITTLMATMEELEALSGTADTIESDRTP